MKKFIKGFLSASFALFLFYGLLHIIRVNVSEDVYGNIFNGICLGVIIFAFLSFVFTPLKIAKLRKLSEIDYSIINRLLSYSMMAWLTSLCGWKNPIIEEIFLTCRYFAYLFYITAFVLSLTGKSGIKKSIKRK